MRQAFPCPHICNWWCLQLSKIFIVNVKKQVSDRLSLILVDIDEMHYHLVCFTKCQMSKVQKSALQTKQNKTNALLHALNMKFIVTECVSYTALVLLMEGVTPIKIPRALKTEQAKLRNIYVYTYVYNNGGKRRPNIWRKVGAVYEKKGKGEI